MREDIYEMRAWFQAPIKALDGRSPRDMILAGELERSPLWLTRLLAGSPSSGEPSSTQQRPLNTSGRGVRARPETAPVQLSISSYYPTCHARRTVLSLSSQ